MTTPRARAADSSAGRRRPVCRVAADRAARIGPPLGVEAAAPPAPLHVRIVRSTAALGYNPINVLLRVLDIAGFAMHAVLRVDLQPRLAGRGFHHDLVHARRTIALFR